MIVEVNRATGIGDEEATGRTSYFAFNDGLTDPAVDWLESLVKDGIVDAICRAASVLDCPDSSMTTYYSIGAPAREKDGTYRVSMREVATNPGACRARQGVVLGGAMYYEIRVVRTGSVWTMDSIVPQLHASTACGFTPEEDSASAARMREDSLLRVQPSPIAGTYRIVVTFTTGDSSVYYARTGASPSSGIRGLGYTDLLDHRERHIQGYYLNTEVGRTVRSIGKDEVSFGTSFAITTVPMAITPDSTLWRGHAVTPIVDVSTLDEREPIRVLARSLYGADEAMADSTYFFVPGVWVTYADGRVEHTWQAGTDSIRSYRVRVSRISRKTRN